ncbi:MAG: hypothetical protein AAFX94_15315, partial [Myxococcota bacterium]
MGSFPGPHSVHGVQLIAFALVENVPAPQGLHARSTLFVGEVDSNVPGVHSVHSAQDSSPPALNEPG